MPQTATKPIRATRITFATSDEKKSFEQYAIQREKTNSVGMNRMREMIRDHKDNRK
ncbi:hypothetical protein [Paenibacillus nanensis]|uniref:hypothetical protein n=1 Tax=Paenibacillus nanensis TaxID=393251 RepID=UPI0013C37533|nr:hypothetical protein [Paenibacillus nanensis]